MVRIPRNAEHEIKKKVFVDKDVPFEKEASTCDKTVISAVVDGALVDGTAVFPWVGFLMVFGR